MHMHPTFVHRISVLPRSSLLKYNRIASDCPSETKEYGSKHLMLWMKFNRAPLATRSSSLASTCIDHRTSRLPRCHFLVYLLSLLLLHSHSLMSVEASSSTSETIAPPREQMTDASPTRTIRVVFSDVDGTLVHYHEEKEQEDNRFLKLPPSATGMQGIISSQTLVYCRELRQTQKLVLISGMRTSTLLKRLPYLPRADAYCSEAGGRIFYPSEPNTSDGNSFTPAPFDGCTPSDLTPFGLVEDLEWRRRMQRIDAAGMQGYGDSLGSEAKVPVQERNGLLWEYARTLTSMGYVLDTKGYSTCFRINRKQQTTISEDEFGALLSGKVPRPAGLGTSTNLGCVDFYPVESGKKNCCDYLARKFCSADDDALAKHAICLCDDDNDLEMALACHHAFAPGVSSDSMARVISDNPRQITATGGPGQALEGTRATEKALQLALDTVSTQ